MPDGVVDEVGEPIDGSIVVEVGEPVDDAIVVEEDEMSDDEVAEDEDEDMSDGGAGTGVESEARTGEMATSPTNPTARPTSKRRYIDAPIYGLPDSIPGHLRVGPDHLLTNPKTDQFPQRRL